METISNALFWISNGLLVPVVVLLLLFFARAVLLAGGFFGEFYRRVHTQKSLAEQLEELTPDNIEEKANSLTGDKSHDTVLENQHQNRSGADGGNAGRRNTGS